MIETLLSQLQAGAPSRKDWLSACCHPDAVLIRCMARMSLSKRTEKPVLKEVPETVVNGKHVYKKGRFLGKGGFARCYELMDTKTKTILAGKIVSKTLLVKQYQKDKMAQEIHIHRSLDHQHVVRLHGFFEDTDNVYILLELCPRRSLMELHKRRGPITDPEARYLSLQVAEGVEYIHNCHIIHRDLKLGNVFLNEEMQVKIGDFGLATTIEKEGERKKTLCGTPNYIAPEVLDKRGHSYEVDVWAVGCIVYTMLAGRPPFETASLKETYQKIKTNTYRIPSTMNPDAAKLVQALLQGEPSRRPKISDVRHFEFFHNGYLPNRLPTSCLTMAPKFDQHMDEMRRVRRAPSPSKALSARQIVNEDMMKSPGRPLHTVPENAQPSSQRSDTSSPRQTIDQSVRSLYKQITEVVKATNNREMLAAEDETEAPECLPVFWISKWVDYSDKYGIGYQLCDNSVGVLYNDSSKLVLDAAGNNMQYVEKDDREEYYMMNREMPRAMEKKLTLLKYFRSYMNEHLIKAGEKFAPKEGDELARLPCLRNWFRTRSAIVLYLSNGTLQLNFFQDHTKLILCPQLGSVTYIDAQKNFRTFKLSLLHELGCSADLRNRLKYAEGMVERLIAKSEKSLGTALPSLSNLHVASQPQQV
ncbi:unnamed protein product, partial [Mesorhabditis spiculigera]